MDRINKDSIESVLSSAKFGLHVREIATQLINTFNGGLFEEKSLNFDSVLKKVNSILANEVKKANSEFQKVKNKKTKKDKKGYYRVVKKKKEGPTITPIPIDVIPKPEIEKTISNNLYTGKAGECAVMSELLFRGYNVNSMLVDDGVDIIASKNNMFYYLQVKTTIVSQGNTISAFIKEKRFNDYIGSQIRYVVVARCILNNIETNMYFVFNNDDIKRYLFGNKAKLSNGNIHIKITIDPKDNKPYIYNGEKRESIEYNVNKFNL